MTKKGSKGKWMVAAAIVIVAIIVAGVAYYVSVPPKTKAPTNSPMAGYIQWLVFYKNGQNATYYSYQTASQLKSEAIMYNGQSVAEVESNFWITPTITLDVGDSITSWSVSGTFDEYMTTSSNTGTILQNSGNQALQPLWAFTGQAPQPKLVSGTAVEIASCPLSASTLESMYSGWQEGQVYNIYNAFSGSVTVNFALAGPSTVQILNGSGSSTITGMFQVEYDSSSTFTVTGAFAYS